MQTLAYKTTSLLTYTVKVGGTLTDATSITVQVVKPDGTNLWGSAKTPTKTATGTYQQELTNAETVVRGPHQTVWTVTSGTNTTEDIDRFWVGELGYLVNEIRSELEDFGNIDFLAAAMTASDTSLTATGYSLYTKDVTLEIGEEIIRGPSADATSTTVALQKRGFRGTIPEVHAQGDMVVFNPKYKRVKIRPLINACLMAELEQPKLSSAVSGVSGTYKYDLPTGVTGKNLRGVYISGDAATIGPLAQDWRILWGMATGGGDQIEFKFSPGSDSIRFKYRDTFSPLNSDSDSSGLPDGADRLLVVYACAHLLPALEAKRLRKDRETFPEGATPQNARANLGTFYIQEFLRLRRQFGLVPNRNIPLTVR